MDVPVASDTGAYFFRARYYHAELGRFISRDPIGYVDGMSLYQAYFATAGVDPSGYLTVRPVPMWGPLDDLKCGKTTAPIYTFSLDHPDSNTEGGYIAQKISIICQIKDCDCRDDDWDEPEVVAEIYEIFAINTPAGTAFPKNGRGLPRHVEDINPIPIRDGKVGYKFYVIEARFIPKSKVDPRSLKTGVWYGPNRECAGNPANHGSVGWPFLSVDGEKDVLPKSEIPKGSSPKWWDQYSRVEGLHRRVSGVAYACCDDGRDYVEGAHFPSDRVSEWYAHWRNWRNWRN